MARKLSLQSLRRSSTLTHEGAAAYDYSKSDPLTHLTFTMGSALFTDGFYETEQKQVRSFAKALMAAGYRVSVEEQADRCIAIEDYRAAGCEIVAEGSWPQAPQDAFILGIKELPAGDTPLSHRHIYFGHVYKDQPGWQQTLGRFVSGEGTLYDLENLVDESGRRVAAFGYWAGYAGAAVAVKAWLGQKTGTPLTRVDAYPDKDVMLTELGAAIADQDERPDMIVIGALGRSGSGAVDLGEALGLSVSKWDMAETASGGPFPEIQRHSIFVNCILASPSCPRFVTAEDIQAADRRLRVISDVSCDPESSYNPIPIYNCGTTFTDPLIRVLEGETPLDVTAIDHLPSMLPKESSEDYSSQLVKVLLQRQAPEADVWGRALADFKHHIGRL